MTISKGKLLCVVWLSVMFAAAAAFGAAPKLSATQEAQLRVNALRAISAAVADVQRKVDYRLSFLDKYLKERELLAEFLKATMAPTAEGEEKQEPKVGDWRDQAKDPDRAVPLTFTEAYSIALEMELEAGLTKVLNTSADLGMLMKQEESLEATARKRFDTCIGGVFDVEKKIAFIKDTERWDDFVEWATEELAVREEEEKARQEALLAQADQRRDEQERLRAEREAAKEQAERDKAEEMEQRWQRKVEAYQLQTERIEARKQNVYYSDSPRWWGRR